jgi:hypothetical protein
VYYHQSGSIIWISQSCANYVYFLSLNNIVPPYYTDDMMNASTESPPLFPMYVVFGFCLFYCILLYYIYFTYSPCMLSLGFIYFIVFHCIIFILFTPRVCHIWVSFILLYFIYYIYFIYSPYMLYLGFIYFIVFCCILLGFVFKTPACPPVCTFVWFVLWCFTCCM